MSRPKHKRRRVRLLVSFETFLSDDDVLGDVGEILAEEDGEYREIVVSLDTRDPSWDPPTREQWESVERKLNSLREQVKEHERREAKGKLLPTKVSKLELALEKRNEELHEIQAALFDADKKNIELSQAIDKVEDQRDEYAGKIQSANLDRMEAEARAKQDRARAARFRTQYLIEEDQKMLDKAGPGASVGKLKWRILAWLGDEHALNVMKIRHDVCPLCYASPACKVGRVPHLHGNNLAGKQTFLQALIDEGLDSGVDPTLVLRNWAEGNRDAVYKIEEAT